MGSIAVACALGCLFAAGLPAAYSNLIAPGDGNTVYFQVRTSFAAESWYAVRNGAVEPVNEPLADVSGSGTVFASASYGERYCGFAGSTCFTAPACAASFTIHGPGISTGNSRRRTFIRLDRGGGLAWIDQDTGCPVLGSPAPTPLNGLYVSSTLRPVAPANGAKLANQRYGRRVITEQRRALVFVGIQLSWLDASGTRPIRHVAAASEAVTDAAGGNIVYVESPVGELHWIDGEDQDLGLQGSAPALTDDGRRLVFLAPDGSLQIYDWAARTVRRLGPDTYLSFTLGGAAAFAVTSDNRLVRIDLDTGGASDLLQSFPDIQSADAPLLPITVLCPLICYGTPDPGSALARGMILVFRGAHLDEGSLRVHLAGMEFPLTTLSDKEAWFQVPSDLPQPGETQTLEIANPRLQFTFSTMVRAQDDVVTCFGTLHQDFSRSVTADDPAAPGEVVHVFLTGLHGVEPIPDGVPNPSDHLIAVANPPPLADPGALDPLFFGLAPGLIGIQQLDVRVLHATSESSLFSGVNQFGCAPPQASAP